MKMIDSPNHQELVPKYITENNLKNENKRIPNSSSIDDYNEAKKEWEALQSIVPTLKSNQSSSEGTPKHFDGKSGSYVSGNSTPSAPPSFYPKITPPTDFDEVWEFFRRQDMSHVMPTIKPTMEFKGVNGLFRTIFGPKKLKLELVSERNLLFAIAQCPLDNEEPLHIQVLLTIYKILTKSKLDCPRYGGHWDHIGFQGLDPATDLRGVGLLGLVQALYLVTNETTLPLARDLYLLSHDPHSEFPLMVLSINVTRISLQALREGVLNRECNSRGNVRHVLNEFFAAVIFHIYWIWRTERKTIKDSGFLIKDAEAYCKSNVRSVLHKLRLHLRRYSHEDPQSSMKYGLS